MSTTRTLTATKTKFQASATRQTYTFELPSPLLPPTTSLPTTTTNDDAYDAHRRTVDIPTCKPIKSSRLRTTPASIPQAGVAEEVGRATKFGGPEASKVIRVVHHSGLTVFRIVVPPPSSPSSSSSDDDAGNDQEDITDRENRVKTTIVIKTRQSDDSGVEHALSHMLFMGSKSFVLPSLPCLPTTPVIDETTKGTHLELVRLEKDMDKDLSWRT